ncbi:hypothetical protein MRS44_012317 [Fusarium solani]|uniref:uncharacterized protein n=1 Tax=Fusarium solani TaxID=169388 RepID=UPI0032C46AB1|nr:hypothetical protein MRS44_012317 [Fusarium solani]
MSQLNLRDPCPQSTSLGPGDLGRSARPSPFASPEVLGTCVYRVPQLRGTGILDLLLPRAIGRDRQTMLGLVDPWNQCNLGCDAANAPKNGPDFIAKRSHPQD